MTTLAANLVGDLQEVRKKFVVADAGFGQDAGVDGADRGGFDIQQRRDLADLGTANF